MDAGLPAHQAHHHSTAGPNPPTDDSLDEQQCVVRVVSYANYEDRDDVRSANSKGALDLTAGAVLASLGAPADAVLVSSSAAEAVLGVARYSRVFSILQVLLLVPAVILCALLAADMGQPSDHHRMRHAAIVAACCAGGSLLLAFVQHLHGLRQRPRMEQVGLQLQQGLERATGPSFARHVV